MSRDGLAEAIGGGGVVGAVRAPDAGGAGRTVAAVAEGGVRAVELWFDGAGSPGRLVGAHKGEELLVGVGGITRAAQAREVGMLGADFVTAAVTAPDVVAACAQMGVPCILSGLTPTEVWRALEMGADFVKVPAETMGGPRYFRSLHETLPAARGLVAAGMPLDGYLPYLEAGVEVLEFGSSLVRPELVEGGEWAEISRHAARIVEDCDRWKARHALRQP